MTDHAAIRARYERERVKRVRPDGNAQYREPIGRFANLIEDPHVAPFTREPMNQEMEVLCCGAGFAGLTAAAHLKQVGIEDVWLVDGAGDVGGTWYWNRYPGAMCDTAAMIYLPMLEETRHRPSQKYVPGTEIFEHAQRVAHTFGLYERTVFSTHVTGMAWQDDRERWLVQTDRGDQLWARFVIAGTGPLNRPKLPAVDGLEEFEGAVFHTARWDYGVTGGDPQGAPLDRLADKRVGIIGTGATAVQCIPVLGRDAQELYVFQRTPSSIDVRNNHVIDPDWFEQLEPGWQAAWQRNFAVLQTGGFEPEDLVKDGWTDISQRIRDRIVEAISRPGVEFTPELIRATYEDCDDDKMEEIRARVDETVADPSTAEALKPWYRQLCKRPCFHDEFLATFNRENVTLVDTDGQGVREVQGNRVLVGDRWFPLDVLIIASGFEVGTAYGRRADVDIVGRNGLLLDDYWSEGMLTMHGIHSHGFPNLFISGMNQGANLISNITHNLVEAGATIAAVVAEAERRGATYVEVTKAAEQAWISAIEQPGASLVGGPDCTPGYYNNEGQAMGRREHLNMSGFPGGPVAYFDYINRWRTDGEFAGLAFAKVETDA